MDWFTSLPLWAVFFGIAVALLACELLTLTFDLLWLGVGGLCGALVAWLVPAAPVWVPTLVSVAVGLTLLVVGRRWAQRQRGINHFVQPADMMVGRHAEVVRAILPPQLGLVKMGNETWSATADYALPSGERVVIVSRSATVVRVEAAA